MIMDLKKRLELIAPAGNMECARAAVANGADAVYFGLEKFNARMRADNFTEEQLPGLVRFLHEHGLRAFCTVNTLIFTDELAEAERELMLLDEPVAGMSARERELTAELLKRICKNRSMIVIEHDMAFVAQIASKVTVMHQGKILAEGTMDQVQNDPKVIDVYLGH